LGVVVGSVLKVVGKVEVVVGAAVGRIVESVN
jgi:hypothetical protein